MPRSIPFNQAAEMPKRYVMLLKTIMMKMESIV